MRTPGAAAMVLLLAMAGLPAGARGEAAASGCPVAPGLLAAPRPLLHAREAVARRRLVVLAVGGSATTARDGGDRTGTYPERMRDRLLALLPGVEVELVLRAAPDASPVRRTAALTREIAAAKPDLVVWASGTREAVRHSDPARYAVALGVGIEAARAARADIILVEPQFAPGWAAIPAIDQYRDAMRTVATLEAVPLLPRFALMQAWHESGLVDLETPDRARQAAVARRVVDCLGEALAALVGKGLE